MKKNRNDENKPDIKTVLIEAAGPLFAAHGLEGTSIRSIVKDAGTALSAVNYHFNTKEQLYAECIDYVLNKKINLTGLFTDTFKENLCSKKILAERLYKFITKLFHAFLGQKTQRWHGLLIMRARMELHPKSRSVLVKFTVPEKLQKYLCRNIPEISDKESWFWVLMLISSFEHYILAMDTVLLTLEMESYTEEFIYEIADYTAKKLIKILDIN